MKSFFRRIRERLNRKPLSSSEIVRRIEFLEAREKEFEQLARTERQTPFVHRLPGTFSHLFTPAQHRLEKTRREIARLRKNLENNK